MIVEPSIEQLRAIIAVAETGGFTAAARRIGRVQSAVSQSVAATERQLGLTLFERARKRVEPTPEGRAVVAHARRILAELGELVGSARALQEGEEAELSFVCDAVFPMHALVELCQRLQQSFPRTALRIGTETLGPVVDEVASERYDLGVAGPAPALPESLRATFVGHVTMVPVVAASHPLAQIDRPLRHDELDRHVQVVLASRDDSTPDIAVVSRRTWRVHDLHAKQALLRAGLGWGNLPAPMIEADVDAGALVKLRVAAWSPDEHRLPLRAVHRVDARQGPALRFALEQIAALCQPTA